MTWAVRVALAATIAVSFVSFGAAGESRFGRIIFRGRPVHTASPAVQQPTYQQYQYNRQRLDDYYRELYPKYYGGFHSRTILNYGYAPGDIGFRGGLGYPGMPW